MTNKSKIKKDKRGLKLLDLSFEGQLTRPNNFNKCPPSTSGRARAKTAWGTTVPAIYRPHGHGGCRGTKSHPPSPYSFNKPADYQSQMQADLERLVADDHLMHTTSPTWAIEVSHESNHSGESPLFVHRFLAPSKYDHNKKHAHYAVHGHQRPLSANDAGHYRPNSTHQYLTTTELRNQSQSDIDVRLGKPTRTTLLRARQRINSAPQNAYEQHREQHKRAEKLAETRRSLGPAYSLQDLLGLGLEEESLHSFLIGARYNRAHYLDSKSLITHGVYMPRANPGGCFVIRRTKPENEPPPAPPESPVDLDGIDIQSSPVTPVDTPRPPQSSHSPIPPPQRPSSPHSAWGDIERAELDTTSSTHKPLDGNDLIGLKLCGNKPREPSDKDMLSTQRGVLHDDGLNVKGVGLDNVLGVPLNRGRPASAHSFVTSTRGAMPSVGLTGTSIPKPYSRVEPLDQSLLTSQPMVSPAPRIHSTIGRRYDETKGRKRYNDRHVQMEDKSFNVPSLNGDPDEERLDVEDTPDSINILTAEAGTLEETTVADSQTGKSAHKESQTNESEPITGVVKDEMIQQNTRPSEVTDTETVKNIEINKMAAKQSVDNDNKVELSHQNGIKADVRLDENAADETSETELKTLTNNTPSESIGLTSAKGRRSRVRFADENNDEVENNQDINDNVKFFVTEEEIQTAGQSQGQDKPVESPTNDEQINNRTDKFEDVAVDCDQSQSCPEDLVSDVQHDSQNEIETREDTESVIQVDIAAKNVDLD